MWTGAKQRPTASRPGNACANPPDYGGRSELEEACRGESFEGYPYARSPTPGICNASDLVVGTTVAAGSLPDCARAHDDGLIFDTSENAWEWIDSCEDGRSVISSRTAFLGGTGVGQKSEQSIVQLRL